MQNNSELRWCSKYLIFKIFFVSFLLQYCLSVQAYDSEGRQGSIPLSRLGRSRLLTALDENIAAGLLAYPNLDRKLWELTKTLIPYPRAGRLVFDPEDYDVLLNIDYSSPELQDSLMEILRSNKPVAQKRGQLKLIPRIGRKKRSISNDEKSENQRAEEDEKQIIQSINDNAMIENLDDSEADYFFAESKKISKNAFAPRVGKKRAEYFQDYVDDKRAAAFTPRIGRAQAFTPRIGRAAAFTPRIGRALIPRIGRTDPRLRLRSRSSFIPRIGRRAALIPRVGRSENS